MNSSEIMCLFLYLTNLLLFKYLVSLEVLGRKPTTLVVIIAWNDILLDKPQGRTAHRRFALQRFVY